MKPGRRDKDLLRKISNSYSALGEKPKGVPRGIAHSHCENWRNPIMSPFFFVDGEPAPSRLRSLERHFANRSGRKKRYDSAVPYFNHVGEASKAAESAGWIPLAMKQTLNLWDSLTPIKLPRGYRICVGGYFEPELREGLRRAMRVNMRFKPDFIRLLERTLRKIEPRVRAVIILDPKGKVAGAGLVAARDGHAYLFCGSVMKAHRRKGLWRALVAARQMTSAELGARFWTMATATEFIMGKGQYSLPLTLYVKPL